MKLGSVSKLDKRNNTTSKKYDVDVMLENCDVIDIFQIFVQFVAVLTKTENTSKKSLTQLLH